jgi:hypothetical protein
VTKEELLNHMEGKLLSGVEVTAHDVFIFLIKLVRIMIGRDA